MFINRKNYTACLPKSSTCLHSFIMNNSFILFLLIHNMALFAFDYSGSSKNTLIFKVGIKYYKIHRMK